MAFHPHGGNGRSHGKGKGRNGANGRNGHGFADGDLPKLIAMLVQHAIKTDARFDRIEKWMVRTDERLTRVEGQVKSIFIMQKAMVEQLQDMQTVQQGILKSVRELNTRVERLERRR